jgi:maltose alpha-D-glucosyltransferase/alpha-amylase
MQSLWLSVVRGDASPLVHALRRLPSVDETNQYAYFVRVHDELTLDKLTMSERDEIMAALAPKESMRLYGRGIRRRVPPMLGGDRRRIENLYSLMFSLPGTPVILYGEEIGLGENLELPDRLAVRVPMQWSADSNGGFSNAPADRLVRPVTRDGAYGYRTVNVAAQRHDPTSLLSFFQKLVHTRRETPEVGWGTWSVVDGDAPGVLAHRCDWQEGTFLAVHNLTGERTSIRLAADLSGLPQEDVLGDRAYPPLDPKKPCVELEPYGYRWVRMRRRDVALDPPPPRR